MQMQDRWIDTLSKCNTMPRSKLLLREMNSKARDGDVCRFARHVPEVLRSGRLETEDPQSVRDDDGYSVEQNKRS